MILAFLIEVVTTFILVYVSLKSTLDDSVAKNVYGFVIGGFYAAISICFSRVNGGTMNPARVMGPAIFDGDIKNLWLYIAGPAVGCSLGALFYRGLYLSSSTRVTEADQHTDLKLLKPVDMEPTL